MKKILHNQQTVGKIFEKWCKDISSKKSDDSELAFVELQLGSASIEVPTTSMPRNVTFAFTM
jgi:hypothetical protein